MKGHRLAVVLSVANFVMLAFHLAWLEPLRADAIAPVLRGRALELLDEKGHVRAEIKVLPAQPIPRMPDGSTTYPETVQLRLFTSTGGPHVKLAATEDGAAMVLGGEPGYVQVLSRGADTLLKLVDREGRQQQIKP